MPRPAPPTDTVRLAVSGTIFGHKWVNVLWLAVTTSGARTINDLNTVIDGVLAAYAARFDAFPGGDVQGITGDASWQTSPTTQLATTRTHAFPSSGSSIDDAAACIVISWKIGLRYRGGKPRTYLPGPTAAIVANGSDITTAAQASIIAAAGAFKNDVDALTGGAITAVQLGTVSWFTAGGSETVPPTYRTPPIFVPYTGAGVSHKLGSQRRRIHS